MSEVFDELKHLIMHSGMSVRAIAAESKVCRRTIVGWLDGETKLPRIDTMLRVARVVGKQIELTGNVRRMVGYYPKPKPRFKLWRLQMRLTP
jgi:transcriptional regulator with XRE-family HTH domain